MLDTAKIDTLLQKNFALPSFRRGQREILEDVLSGKDTMAVMPTGGGKSLCYQLPSQYQSGIVLVVSPLISLMRDQVAGLHARGIQAGCIHSDQSEADKKQIFQEIKTQNSYLLYLSPERIQKPGFLTWLKTAPISLIAIDEAHCVSQWGPDFRQDYYKLNLLRENRSDIPILALTATATPQVLNDIGKQLMLKNPARHVYGFYRPNLYYQVEFCEDDNERLAFLLNAIAQTPSGRIIIYVGTRKRCEELSAQLASQFKDVAYYHAGMSNEERIKVQNHFTQGTTRILFATNAFGMGVDFADIRLVVHFQIPGNIESYYQEIGRAGRDGNDATCLLLYARRDKGLHSYFITKSDAPKNIIQQRWRALDTIIEYAEGGECRHAGILTYFRDTQRLNNCGHCDVCHAKSPRKIQRPQVGEKLPNLKSKLAKPKNKKTVLDQSPLSGVEQRRYDHIKQWRHSYAQTQDLPAFIIFSNKTLHDLIKKNPKSLQAMYKVHGLASHKIEAFGEILLQQLSESC